MSQYLKNEQIIKGVIDFIRDTTSAEVFPQVVNDLAKVIQEENEAKIAYIYTTVKLTPAQKQAIKKKLEKQLRKEVVLKEIIDKRLIAGFKIKIGDWVYDASIAGQLELFKNEMYASI